MLSSAATIAVIVVVGLFFLGQFVFDEFLGIAAVTFIVYGLGKGLAFPYRGLLRGIWWLASRWSPWVRQRPQLVEVGFWGGIVLAVAVVAAMLMFGGHHTTHR